MKSLVIGGLAMSVSLLSAAQAEQPLPPGRYCGFVDLAHVGIVVYPTQADGRLRVSVSSLWNKEDWGGTTLKTAIPAYRVITNNFPLEGVVAGDGTLNLWWVTDILLQDYGSRMETLAENGHRRGIYSFGPSVLEIVRDFQRKNSICYSTE